MVRRRRHAVRRRRQGQVGVEAHGRALQTQRATAGLASASKGAHGRVLDSRLLVAGQGEFHETVVVLEHFGVALHTGLPVLVDSTLERGLSSHHLVGMRGGLVVVVGILGNAVQVSSMSGLAAIGELAKVIKNVVLGMGTDPSTVKLLASNQLKTTQGDTWNNLPDVIIDRLHYPLLGMLDGQLQALGLALTGRVGGSGANGTVGIHSDDGWRRRRGCYGAAIGSGCPR